MSSEPKIEFVLPDRVAGVEITPATIGLARGTYDSAALDRFIEAGTRAWADVPDAAEWVRQLRGGRKLEADAEADDSDA